MRQVLVAVCLIAAGPLTTLEGWGTKGHSIVNRLALDQAAAQLPAFLKARAAQLVYLGSEPDRWREEAGSAMNAAQVVDHYFDSERWGAIASLPPDRLAFLSALAARRVAIDAVGTLPYAILENYGRLRSAFRQYRKADTAEDRELAAASAVLYAGLLGHYVADATMPMHVSIHFNGWAADTPNPRRYTTSRRLHARYEDAFVEAAIEIADVRPRVRRPTRQADVFTSVVDHLTQTFAELEPMYALEKRGEFNPAAPRPKGREFVAEELARASSQLGNLWLTAWNESAEAVQR